MYKSINDNIKEFDKTIGELSGILTETKKGIIRYWNRLFYSGFSSFLTVVLVTYLGINSVKNIEKDIGNLIYNISKVYKLTPKVFDCKMEKQYLKHSNYSSECRYYFSELGIEGLMLGNDWFETPNSKEEASVFIAEEIDQNDLLYGLNDILIYLEGEEKHNQYQLSTSSSENNYQDWYIFLNPISIQETPDKIANTYLIKFLGVLNLNDKIIIFESQNICILKEDLEGRHISCGLESKNIDKPKYQIYCTKNNKKLDSYTQNCE